MCSLNLNMRSDHLEIIFSGAIPAVSYPEQDHKEKGNEMWPTEINFLRGRKWKGLRRECHRLTQSTKFKQNESKEQENNYSTVIQWRSSHQVSQKQCVPLLHFSDRSLTKTKKAVVKGELVFITGSLQTLGYCNQRLEDGWAQKPNAHWRLLYHDVGQNVNACHHFRLS